MMEAIDYLKDCRLAKPAMPQLLYQALLDKHLSGRPKKEIRFFYNEKRFYLLHSLLGDQLAYDIKTILNVACGPFAFEHYVNPPAAESIDAFDLDEALVPLFDDMQSRGKLLNCHFELTSLEAFTPLRQYDLVLINDVFYTKHVNFFDHIEKYTACVKPGGYFYFDILDKKAEWLWKSLGKDKRYVRYNLKDVEEALDQYGLKIINKQPSLGIKGGSDYFLRKTVHSKLDIANNYIYLCQK